MSTKQMDMFGPPVEPDLGNLSPLQKAELLLDENPQARNDDLLLMLLWWERFDALGTLFHWTLRDLFKGEMDDEELQVMTDAAMDRFHAWFRSTATHPETLRDLFKGEMDDEELQVMTDAAMDRFHAWFRSTATHPETIRRRRAELQSNRKKHGTLRGSAGTTAYRKARDGAGPPRR